MSSRLSLLGLVLATGVASGCAERSLVVGDELAITQGTGGAAGGGATTPRTSDFLLGADISWVQEEEDSGTVYLDNGVEKDIVQLLGDHGFNAIRLRLFNDPGSPCRTSAYGDTTCGYQFEFAARAEPYCDLAHTVEMAQRVKAAGMRLLLNFHYSDTWADPNDQNKPLAWESLDFDALVSAVAAFTRDSLATLRDAGALPDLVQLGNEITPGLLYPDGSSSAPGNFPRFAELLRAATGAVRSVDPSILIMLHIEKPDSFPTSDWWLSNVLSEGVDFDVLGQSCYTEWHGQPEGWATTFTELATSYPDLDFVIAEYSQEKRATNDIMYELPAGRGLGTFVWEPTQWRETLFTRQNNQLVTNPLITLYDQMAEDYGLR